MRASLILRNSARRVLLAFSPRLYQESVSRGRELFFHARP
jgi:hypothetical protein